MMPALSRVLMRTRKMVGGFLHVLATGFVGGDLLEFRDDFVGIEAEFLIEIALLAGRDQVEQQRLEAVGRPVLD